MACPGETDLTGRQPFKVLLYEPMDEAGTALLASRAEVITPPSTDEEEILRCVDGVDAIVVRANGRVTARVMEAAPKLRVVARHGVGVDNIDVEAATERGIWVVNTPLANCEAVAEHVVAMMLMLAKRMRSADAEVRLGRWEARYTLIGVELRDRALGVVGMGRIGSRVAEICHRAFGMQILYHDLVPREAAEAELGARRCDLPELFSLSDFVSLHVPGSPETHHLVAARLLSAMKPTAYLINTSRGGVVDEEALVAALREGRIAGAGLDVFENEFTADHLPIFDLENVVLTPHGAAHTQEALVRMSLVAEDVLRVLDGEPPQNPVNQPR